ncbi:MAG: hypothetical protein OXR07_08835 [Nitrospira sp.]|nr:hypothetical protein [Nitrospira sp.]
MTCTIEDFLEQVIIRRADGTLDTFPVKAYVVDQPPQSGKCGHSLKHELRMDTFHCCDYIFVPDDNEVLLIEDSNLKSKRDDLEKKTVSSVGNRESGPQLSDRLIRDEQLLKAYASLLLLCRLFAQDETATKKMQGKNIRFLFIINDADPTDSHLFDYLENKIAPTLRPLVDKVLVRDKEGAKEKLSNYASPTP